MNTEAIRAKFEDVETVEVLWGGQIQYDKGDNKYYNVGSAHFDDCDALNQRWAGYQQAVKDMEAENEKLRAFPDFKVPSECVARFMGHNDPLEALNKAALVACGFNECRDWFKAERGRS